MDWGKTSLGVQIHCVIGILDDKGDAFLKSLTAERWTSHFTRSVSQQSLLKIY